MDDLTQDIEDCRQAHRRLLDHVEHLTDDLARSASRLPGWSIGHVLTHLARNADSITHRLDGARRDELVDQYPGGQKAKFAAIEAGAGRPADELIADLTAASNAVDEAFSTMDASLWDRPTRHGSGHLYPVSVLPFRRWREVEVHMVDLGLGYDPSNWPTRLVDQWLPLVLGQLPDRTDPNALLAWVLRRGDPPPLTPY